MQNRYFVKYIKKRTHGGREEAVGVFFFFKKKALKLFLVCDLCVQRHDGTSQSEQPFLLGTIQNGALLSLPGHPWFRASFY